MKHMTRKARSRSIRTKDLIFEKSSPAKPHGSCRRSTSLKWTPRNFSGSSERKDLGNMPEVSEIEIIRHFTRLSTWNYAIDLGMYPLVPAP